MKVAFVPVGESNLELLEPTDPTGPVAKFIATKGAGFHHISFRVSDIEGKLKQLQKQGVELIDQEPRYGAGGAKIAFLHPRSTGGVLIELSEH